MSGKKKVLIVDDDHDTLDILEVFLFRRYDVSTALNGFEGLSKAQDLLPHLILTDIMMPVMDGIKFINNLRRNPETKSIPAIAVTSFTEKHSSRSLLNIGFTDVITKPFTQEDVKTAVEGILNPQAK